MKKHLPAIILLITTIAASVYAVSQKRRADAWEKKAYIMGQEAAEYKMALEQKEKEAIQMLVLSEKSASDAARKSNPPDKMK